MSEVETTLSSPHSSNTIVMPSLQDWKLLRKKMGLTLRQVEEKTGISNAYLSQLENGKIKKPSFKIVSKLFELFNSRHLSTDVCLCPNCKSDKVKDISKYESNGVFGPGGASWKSFDAMSCEACGVIFRKVAGNGA